LQRQTVISQFYQLDKLVVEGQKTVSHGVRHGKPICPANAMMQGKETGDKGDIVRQKDTGYV
jgi:hypothetical protein